MKGVKGRFAMVAVWKRAMEISVLLQRETEDMPAFPRNRRLLPVWLLL